MLVKEIPKHERPREKALKYGVGHLSNVELLAILIRTGYQGVSSLSIAQEILYSCNGIENIPRLDLNDLLKIKGIKKIKALEILSFLELSKRISYEQSLDKDVIDKPDKMIKWLNKEIGSCNQEKFMVIYLNVKNMIITYKILFVGTVDASIVNSREILKEALILSSSKIILVHNHPSGDVTPSEADIKTTLNIINAANFMNIKVIDHIIVSNNNFFSFAKEKLL